MLIVVWAAVCSVSVLVAVVSKSNSPYEQRLAGAVVVLLMLSVVGPWEWCLQVAPLFVWTCKHDQMVCAHLHI
jgi:hypothetical protein